MESVRGRFPRWKILKDGEQIAMWAPERGGFSIAKGVASLTNATAQTDSIERKYL